MLLSCCKSVPILTKSSQRNLQIWSLPGGIWSQKFLFFPRLFTKEVRVHKQQNTLQTQCVVLMGFMEASYDSVLLSVALSSLRHSQKLENWDIAVTQKLSSCHQLDLPCFSRLHHMTESEEWKGNTLIKTNQPTNQTNQTNKQTSNIQKNHQILKLHLLGWSSKASW